MTPPAAFKGIPSSFNHFANAEPASDMTSSGHMIMMSAGMPFSLGLSWYENSPALSDFAADRDSKTQMPHKPAITAIPSTPAATRDRTFIEISFFRTLLRRILRRQCKSPLMYWPIRKIGGLCSAAGAAMNMEETEGGGRLSVEFRKQDARPAC